MAKKAAAATSRQTKAPPVDYASAMDKLREEMAKNDDNYVKVVGEYLTDYLLQHPEAEAAMLNKDKSIKGSLDAVRKEAQKVKQGNVAVLDDRTVFGIVLGYYGIKGTGNREQGTGITGQANEMPDSVEAPAPTEEAHVTAATADPFDLDALLGVM